MLAALLAPTARRPLPVDMAPPLSPRQPPLHGPSPTPTLTSTPWYSNSAAGATEAAGEVAGKFTPGAAAGTEQRLNKRKRRARLDDSSDDKQQTRPAAVGVATPTVVAVEELDLFGEW